MIYQPMQISEHLLHAIELILACPKCGDTGNHVVRVGTELDPESGDEARVYPGTSLVCKRRSRERRSAVRVDFNGECGHGWSLILQQHKGVMTLYTRMLDEVWEEVEGGNEPKTPRLPSGLERTNTDILF